MLLEQNAIMAGVAKSIDFSRHESYRIQLDIYEPRAILPHWDSTRRCMNQTSPYSATL